MWSIWLKYTTLLQYPSLLRPPHPHPTPVILVRIPSSQHLWVYSIFSHKAIRIGTIIRWEPEVQEARKAKHSGQ